MPAPYDFRNDFFLSSLCCTALMIFFFLQVAMDWKGYPRTGYILGKEKLPHLEMSESPLLKKMPLIIW